MRYKWIFKVVITISMLLRVHTEAVNLLLSKFGAPVLGFELVTLQTCLKRTPPVSVLLPVVSASSSSGFPRILGWGDGKHRQNKEKYSFQFNLQREEQV